MLSVANSNSRDCNNVTGCVALWLYAVWRTRSSTWTWWSDHHMLAGPLSNFSCASHSPHCTLCQKMRAERRRRRRSSVHARGVDEEFTGPCCNLLSPQSAVLCWISIDACTSCDQASTVVCQVHVHHSTKDMHIIKLHARSFDVGSEHMTPVRQLEVRRRCASNFQVWLQCHFVKTYMRFYWSFKTHFTSKFFFSLNF